jgi:hypothetical protein
MVLVRRGQGREILLMEPTLFKFHRYLLMLGHTRCYSTLLCHILGSHPQICGYSEAMLSFETAVDLIRLNSEVFRAGNYRNDAEYVVDKVLYDMFHVSDAVLGNPRVTPLFIIREPEPSIPSLVRMRIREHEQGIIDWGPGGTDRESTTRFAAEYYVKRLGTLQEMCIRLEAMGKRGIFLAADSLLADTAATFWLIERELGLSEPLREEYTIFPNTGELNSGDTSSIIRSGRIIRDRDHPDEEPIPIPPDLLDRARQAHAECLATLQGSPVLARAGE